MKRWVLALCFCLALGRVYAQPGDDILSATSASRQFKAYAPRRAGIPVSVAQQSKVPGLFILNSTPAARNGSTLRLDPYLLVTSAERIKQSLLTTLGQRDQWQGAISLFINPNLQGDQMPVPERVFEARSWEYRLTVPASIEPKLLLRTITGALLLEMANRQAGTQSAEVPLWLVIGLSGHLQKENAPTLLLAPQSRLDFEETKDPRVDPLRDRLRRQPPLTFQQLCWPEPDRLNGQNYDFYAASAQLFVEELLRFGDGQRCLHTMIGQFARHLNWQTSFLQAFAPHFTQLLDVEKWWALSCVNYTRVDFASRFAPEDSFRKLQHALDVPVQVHLAADRLPAQAEINLQEVISTWEAEQAAAALKHVASDLTLLRLRLAPGLRPLLDSYLGTVQKYLNDTGHDNLVWLAKYRPSEWTAIRRSACRELDALDVQRDAMRTDFVPQALPGLMSQRPASLFPGSAPLPAAK